MDANISNSKNYSQKQSFESLPPVQESISLDLQLEIAVTRFTFSLTNRSSSNWAPFECLTEGHLNS